MKMAISTKNQYNLPLSTIEESKKSGGIVADSEVMGLDGQQHKTY
jgi:hypothetical protein